VRLAVRWFLAREVLGNMGGPEAALSMHKEEEMRLKMIVVFLALSALSALLPACADEDDGVDEDGGADGCPVFSEATALQGWFENEQDNMWSFEADVSDEDGDDDVESVNAILEDPATGDPLHVVELQFVESASEWQGYALQADIGLDCCGILYDVTFVATDASECATTFETTVVNDEP